MKFDLEDLNAEDTGEMVVMSNGEPTNWVWTFAGPAHDKTVAQSNRISREELAAERALTTARANGRKFKPEPETVEERRTKNVSFVIERLLGWHLTDDKGERIAEEVTMAGKPFPFSEENARLLLSDRRKQGLLVQTLEFLGDERSFTHRSA